MYSNKTETWRPSVRLPCSTLTSGMSEVVFERVCVCVCAEEMGVCYWKEKSQTLMASKLKVEAVCVSALVINNLTIMTKLYRQSVLLVKESMFMTSGLQHPYLKDCWPPQALCLRLILSSR